jgi:hypothetical protein
MNRHGTATVTGIAEVAVAAAETGIVEICITY